MKINFGIIIRVYYIRIPKTSACNKFQSHS